MTDAIANALGIEPLEKEQLPATTKPIQHVEVSVDKVTDVEFVPVSRLDPTAQEDFDFARAMIRDAMTEASELMGEMKDLAQQMQHPRAYEVATGMVTAIVNASKQLMEINKQKVDIATPIPQVQRQLSDGSMPAQGVNMSTSELLRLVKEARMDS